VCVCELFEIDGVAPGKSTFVGVRETENERARPVIKRKRRACGVSRPTIIIIIAIIL